MVLDEKKWFDSLLNTDDCIHKQIKNIVALLIVEQITAMDEIQICSVIYHLNVSIPNNEL